jgi:hypothetical protein
LYCPCIEYCFSNDNKKKKLYIEKLKIIKQVKNGKLKAGLFLECGILEGTVHGWMKVEDKLGLFVDFIVDDIQLQRRKTRLFEKSSVEECLYKWFL